MNFYKLLLLISSMIFLIYVLLIPIKTNYQYVFKQRTLNDIYSQQVSKIYDNIFNSNIRFQQLTIDY